MPIRQIKINLYGTSFEIYINIHLYGILYMDTYVSIQDRYVLHTYAVPPRVLELHLTLYACYTKPYGCYQLSKVPSTLIPLRRPPCQYARTTCHPPPSRPSHFLPLANCVIAESSYFQLHHHFHFNFFFYFIRRNSLCTKK